MTKYKLRPLYEFNKRLFFPIEKQHLEKLKEWRNVQMGILRQWKPLTDYNQEKWFQEVSESNNQVIFSIIILNKNKNEELIGYCGLINIDYINKRAELSFLLKPERVSKRDVYKDDFISALNVLCRYGFFHLNFNKIFTETFSFRDFHIKILEIYGFKKDGILRKHQYTNGRYCDSIIHSILKNEFFKKYGGNKIEK